MSTVERGSFLYVESQITSTLYCPRCKENVSVLSGVGYPIKPHKNYCTCYYCNACKKLLHVYAGE